MNSLRYATIPFKYKQKNVNCQQIRSFWEYVNMMFNKPDPDRIKKLGPDRTCAEWVLRNGGSVVWIDGKRLTDYNCLPPEDEPVQKLQEIDGSNSAISHYGFEHMRGCTSLRKLILHNGSYIDDEALTALTHARDLLTHIQVSKCLNITDVGLKKIEVLHKLEFLTLFGLDGVKNIEECKQYLQNKLPRCKINNGIIETHGKIN